MVRFESAITEIRVAMAAVSKPLSQRIAIAVSVWRHDNPALTLRSVAGASLAKRGPPSSLLLISSN
jgi:hypothetical protein